MLISTKNNLLHIFMNLFIFTLNLQCIHVFDVYNFTVVFIEKSRLQLKFWERRIGKGGGGETHLL